MGISEDLIKLKTKIEGAQTELSRLEGRLQEAEDRLKSTFKVSTIEEARKLLVKMQADLDRVDAEVETGIETLNKKLGAS